MITMERCETIPESVLANLTPGLTEQQKNNLHRVTDVVFVIRRGGSVVCCVGLANAVLLSDFYGIWFGLPKGQRLTFTELRMVNLSLDCLSRYYEASFRAMVDASNVVHLAFAKFCRFIPYGESLGYITYERRAV